MRSVFADITSPRLLILKGLLFVVLGVLTGVLLVVGVLIGMEWWAILLLHALGVWAWCRAYYCAFYVIGHYAEPGARYAGLFDAARRSWRLLFARPSR